MTIPAAVLAAFQYAGRFTGLAIGSSYQHYNPIDPLNPLSTAAYLGTLDCWITADNKGMATTAIEPQKPPAYSWHDTALSTVGDYLIGPLGTFFIGSQNVPMPVQVILCNTVLSFARPGASALGSAFYSGDMTADESTLMSGWPACVIQGTKGEKGEVNLPGDVRVPWMQILVPDPGIVALRIGDQAQDNAAIPNRYTLSSVELTARGYRLSAMLETP
jgi:hypothetical protein